MKPKVRKDRLLKSKIRCHLNQMRIQQNGILTFVLTLCSFRIFLGNDRVLIPGKHPFRNLLIRISCVLHSTKIKCSSGVRYICKNDGHNTFGYLGFPLPVCPSVLFSSSLQH